MAWTDKMVEDLKVMWKQGLTTGEIGKRLGVSKNSIVGKVHRLQLDARPSPIKKKEDNTPKDTASVPETSPQKTQTKDKKTADTQEKKEQKNISSTPVTTIKTEKKHDGHVHLTDLDNHTCRWPIGDPKDENFHFCGKKVKIGQTYCEEHAALAYVKPTKK